MDTEVYEVAILGAGLAGLGMGMKLKMAGEESFVILEREDRVGGTWRDNSYPGASCDVQSHLYWFSFDEQPDWSRVFALQPEIQANIERLVARRGLNHHIRLNAEVTEAVWLDDRGHWLVPTLPGEPERARAFGAWSASGGVGGMVGALAGGVLTTGISWRWVFLRNVPIGVVLVAVAMTSLAARPVRRESLDLAGAVTGTAGLGAVVHGVMQAADHAWTSAQVVVPVGGGVLLLAVFLVVEKRFAPAPLLPLRLFGNRGVALGNAMLLLFGGVAVAMWFFTSLFLQNVSGWSAFGAGLGQTPAAVMFVVVARWAAGRLRRTGARRLVLAGCAGLAAGFGWLSTAGAGSHYLTGILGPTLLVAAGIGLVFPTLMASATADVAPGDAGVAGGLANTAGQVGGSVALAGYAAAAAAADGGGYEPVFRLAVGVTLAMAAAGLLLPARPHP